MDVSEHIGVVAEQGGLLLEAAEEAGLGAAVPTCPGWVVGDLVAHMAGVHRWATSFLLTGRPGPVTDEEDAEYFRRPADSELLAWARSAHADLVGALAEAPASWQCWTFLPAPSPLAFWARRQAHETAVHRVDAASALARRCRFPDPFAADGVDELLSGLFARPRGRLVSDPPVSLGVVLDGSDRAWTLDIGPTGRRASAGAEGVDCLVSGPASDVYQLLWNRLSVDDADVKVQGDLGVLELWRAKAVITWS